VKDIHDVIKHAKFGDDRLRGSGVVAGQISAFPIDFAGRPYNTLTLPCERVISFSFCRQHHPSNNSVIPVTSWHVCFFWSPRRRQPPLCIGLFN